MDCALWVMLLYHLAVDNQHLEGLLTSVFRIYEVMSSKLKLIEFI